MPLSPATTAALEQHGLKVQHDAPLVKKTWWRAGGLADGFVKVSTPEELVAVQTVVAQTDCPLFVLGNASNLLIADAGIRGLVIRLGGALAKAEDLGGDVLQAGGGLKLTLLVNRLLRNQWTGLEFFAGIPGTVGGAVRMNAGTRLGEVVDRLVEVDWVLRGGEAQTVPASALNMSYRTSHVPDGAVVARARFRLGGVSPEVSAQHIQEHLDHRKHTQPIDQPSCGSTFRNPPGDYAGRLIEASGLKGFTIGGAQVSTKHANFIVNTGEATAADIRRVIEHVQATVKRDHGVDLQREVHFAGDWSGWQG